MGFWGDVLEVGAEVGSLAVEAGELAGEATPFVGAGINGGKAIYHSSLAHDAELAGDQQTADHYGSEAAYDWVKAIPGVGTAMGVGELAEGTVGAVGALADGKGMVGAGKGFMHGMDNFKDTFKDLGAMAGVDEFGAKKYGHLGAHSELREHAEDSERFKEAAERAKKAKGKE